VTAQDEPPPVWRDTLKDALSALDPAQRRRFPRLARELRTLLDRADPLEHPGGDYGFVVDGLLLRLLRSCPPDELADWLQAELRAVGSGDPDPAQTRVLARVLHEWYTAAVREEDDGSHRL
jgi:hypothetical protein